MTAQSDKLITVLEALKINEFKDRVILKILIDKRQSDPCMELRHELQQKRLNKNMRYYIFNNPLVKINSHIYDEKLDYHIFGV